MTPTVDIELDDDAAECGDTVRGEIRWDGFDKAPRRVVVSLVHRTDGRAGDETEVAAVRLGGGVSGSGSFELMVPPDGPITYAGHLFTVTWVVRARFDLAMERDPTFDEPLAVLPARGLTLWAQRVAPPPEA